MGHTIRIVSPSVIVLLSSLSPWGAPAPARAAELKPILLDVLVPADTELVVDGYKTQSTGEERHFESPPVEVGKTYAYTVKATWRGHTVSRRVRLGPDKLTTLDLREELQEAAPPAPGPDRGPEIVPDKRPATEPESKRNGDGGNVPGPEIAAPKAPGTRTVKKPEGDPKPAPETNLETPQKRTEQAPTKKAQEAPQKKTEEVPPRKGEEAPPKKVEEVPPKKEPDTPRTVKGGKGPDESPKTAPDQPPAEKPTRPAPAPEPRSSSSLLIQSPAEVTLRPGRTRYVEVRVSAAGDSPLTSEPKVQLSSAAGLRVAPWTASGFKDGQTVYTAGFAVTAEPSATGGPREVKITASVGEDRAERVLKVAVTP